jgi:lipoprotein signal peptidase
MTFFIPISRGIITKGVGFSVLADQVVWLSIYIVIVMILAAVTFKQKLD